MVGQSSPVQFAPHLSAAMPGRVTPLLPEVSPRARPLLQRPLLVLAPTDARPLPCAKQIWSPKDNPAHMSRKCCRRSADLGTKRKEGSAAVNMQSGKKVLEQKRTGPHHGVRCRAGRRCLSTEPPEIDDSSLCAVPSYVVDPYVKQIGIDAARQFVEVMTKTPPQTPQARASASPGGVQVKSFPFEPL